MVLVLTQFTILVRRVRQVACDTVVLVLITNMLALIFCGRSLLAPILSLLRL
jgi:hypothetical protein